MGINGNLIHNVPTGTLSIFTSTDGSTGSKILLNGHDVVGDDNGGIKLVGQGTYGSHTLMIGKNGLQADGKQLVRSVDGVNADTNGNVNLNGKYLPIGGGTITGALTVNGNSVVGGRNVVRSVNGVTAGSDGNVSIKTGGGDHYVTSAWHSGHNGYRRWNDGYIEQWGYIVSPSEGQNVTVTLHQRLSSADSAVVLTSVFSINYMKYQWNSPSFGSSGLNSTTLTLYIDDVSRIRGKYWYVCGY